MSEDRRKQEEKKKEIEQREKEEANRRAVKRERGVKRARDSEQEAPSDAEEEKKEEPPAKRRAAVAAAPKKPAPAKKRSAAQEARRRRLREEDDAAAEAEEGLPTPRARSRGKKRKARDSSSPDSDSGEAEEEERGRKRSAARSSASAVGSSRVAAKPGRQQSDSPDLDEVDEEVNELTKRLTPPGVSDDTKWWIRSAILSVSQDAREAGTLPRLFDAREAALRSLRTQLLLKQFTARWRRGEALGRNNEVKIAIIVKTALREAGDDIDKVVDAFDVDAKRLKEFRLTFDDEGKKRGPYAEFARDKQVLSLRNVAEYEGWDVEGQRLVSPTGESGSSSDDARE